MYKACFGLSQRPFAPVPTAGQYFPAETIEAARQTLTRCIQRAEGAAMVIGPSGTGKTLLCRVLADQFRSTLAVAVLGSGRLSSRSALYQAILYELRRTYRGMDEGELRLALVDYLTTCDDRPDGLVLLVDEAHTLPLRLLDEIRMLTNLVGGGQSRVRVLLAGSALLEERFANPKLESFSQRLVARCYLEPLGREETTAYLRAQVHGAGGDGARLFAADAAEAVYHATDGVPRLINQVCDHALVLACTDGKSQIDARTIEAAWADLQQLPTPWNDDVDAPDAASVIEFGTLDDEPAPCEPALCDADAVCDPLAACDEVVRAEPAEQLEQIEETLARLDDLDEDDDEAALEVFRPAGTIGPEVELTFAYTGNPFEEPFEEEEIIRQRYESARRRERAERGGSREEVAGTFVASPSPPDTDPAPPVQPPARPASDPAVARVTVPWTPPKSVPLDESQTAEDGPRITVGRPSEYRQLFVKLRRG